MKRIEYRAEIEELKIYITGQTHRGIEFGSHRSREWFASNGIHLVSSAMPDWGRTVYVRGIEESQDDTPLICPSSEEFTRVLEAMDEYNRYFSDDADEMVEEQLTRRIDFDTATGGIGRYYTATGANITSQLMGEMESPTKKPSKNSPCKECRGAVLCDNCRKKSREMISF